MLSEAIINCSSCRNFLSPSPLVPLELSIIYRRSKRHHRLYSLGDHLSVVFALHKQHNNTSSCKTPSDTRVILHAWLCNLLHFAFYGLWLRWSFVLPFDECKKTSARIAWLGNVWRSLNVCGLCSRVSCDFDPVLCELLCTFRRVTCLWRNQYFSLLGGLSSSSRAHNKF